MKYLLALIVVVLLCPFSGQCQWMTVANYGQVVTVPAGMLLRYGSATDNLWVMKTTPFLQNTTFTVGGGEFPVSPDPTAASNTFVLQAYQIPLAQAITVDGTSMAVPAATLAAAKTGTTATSVAGNTTFTVNMTVTPGTNQIAPNSTCGFK